jgi:hypothetical protein
MWEEEEKEKRIIQREIGIGRRKNYTGKKSLFGYSSFGAAGVVHLLYDSFVFPNGKMWKKKQTPNDKRSNSSARIGSDFFALTIQQCRNPPRSDGDLIAMKRLSLRMRNSGGGGGSTHRWVWKEKRTPASFFPIKTCSCDGGERNRLLKCLRHNLIWGKTCCGARLKVALQLNHPPIYSRQEKFSFKMSK